MAEVMRCDERRARLEEGARVTSFDVRHVDAFELLRVIRQKVLRVGPLAVPCAAMSLSVVQDAGGDGPR